MAACSGGHGNSPGIQVLVNAFQVHADLSMRFRELAVFDARLYIRVRHVDQLA
jgi:hypothetical protein